MSLAAAAPRSRWSQFIHEMRTGFHRQCNVVFALLFKDFRVKTSNGRLGLVWVAIEPAIHILVLGSLWYLAGRTAIAGMNIGLFLATGVLPYLIVRRSLQDIPSALGASDSFYNYQQVKPVDAVIARFILDMLLLIIGGFLVLFLLAWFFDAWIKVENGLPLIGVLLTAMAMGFGVSLLLATYGYLYEGLLKGVSAFSRPLMFVSAVFYTPNDLPAEARYFLSWNPIVQIIEYIRYYALGIRLFPEADFWYALLWALCALFLGAISYYANRFRLIEK
jgi:capsular polysaccharide transport system permease protein